MYFQWCIADNIIALIILYFIWILFFYLITTTNQFLKRHLLSTGPGTTADVKEAQDTDHSAEETV